MIKLLFWVVLLCLTSRGHGAPLTCLDEQVDDSTLALTCYGVDSSTVAEFISELDILASIDGIQINLELRDSVITDLPSDLLQDYPIRSLALTNDGLQEFPQAFLESINSPLVVLSLASNAISDINAGHFQNLQFLDTLQILVLSRNQLTSLPDTNVFQAFPNLQKLLLQMNQLTGLPAKTFDGLNELTELQLYGNQIQKVNVGSFGTLPKLTKLFFNENEIQSLESGTWSAEKFPLLKHIYLGNNPFICDCDLDWLNVYLNGSGLLMGCDATCQTPFLPFELVIFCLATPESSRVNEEKWVQLLDNVNKVIMKDPRERAYRWEHGMYL